MKLEKITLDSLLDELNELPSDWMDDRARDVVALVKVASEELRHAKRPITSGVLAGLLGRDPDFLDVCRLFLAKSQEAVAHELSDALGGESMGWARLRSHARKEPERMAQALVALDLPHTIQQQLDRQWRAEDILIERYKMTRGRAIAGQKRGRALEDEVEVVLKATGVPFERSVTFTGHKGETAKCDFAVPSRSTPKIVIEVKGFEATGSKLTDFLGDVLKIGQAKSFHMYFFLVTDGRGWHHRVSDLRHLVQYHRDGIIDMIYTQQRLEALAQAARHIYENE